MQLLRELLDRVQGLARGVPHECGPVAVPQALALHERRSLDRVLLVRAAAMMPTLRGLVDLVVERVGGKSSELCLTRSATYDRQSFADVGPCFLGRF